MIKSWLIRLAVCIPLLMLATYGAKQLIELPVDDVDCVAMKKGDKF